MGWVSLLEKKMLKCLCISFHCQLAPNWSTLKYHKVRPYRDNCSSLLPNIRLLFIDLPQPGSVQIFSYFLPRFTNNFFDYDKFLWDKFSRILRQETLTLEMKKENLRTALNKPVRTKCNYQYCVNQTMFFMEAERVREGKTAKFQP